MPSPQSQYVLLGSQTMELSTFPEEEDEPPEVLEELEVPPTPPAELELEEVPKVPLPDAELEEVVVVPPEEDPDPEAEPEVEPTPEEVKQALL